LAALPVFAEVRGLWSASWISGSRMEYKSMEYKSMEYKSMEYKSMEYRL
jgi:hypothetical protein